MTPEHTNRTPPESVRHPTASAGTPIVTIDGVTFAYGDLDAVRDITLTIEHGDFLGLIGPNGSGKTTLLHLMLGLLTPDRGTIELFGQPIEDFDQGHRIGYVSQQATNRATRMPITVRETVQMGRFAHAGHTKLSDTDRDAVEDALSTVDIASLADRRLNQLSGGQRQRAYIARALASEADFLALDEPAVGVDADSRDRFYGLLESLNASGITIILIEHDIGVVTDRANRIACLNTELFHHGDTASFVESDALSAAYGTTTRIVHHHH